MEYLPKRNIYRNSAITVEHIDGSNRHTYGIAQPPRPVNPNAMYVAGIANDFAQGTTVFVYVSTSTPALEATIDWSQYSNSPILVEEFDGRNWHIYPSTGRATNADAMHVFGTCV